MSKETNHIDQFLRGSLEGLKIEPQQSVWKGVSKRLILLELLRLNFTNIGKSWLYTGLATVGAIAGITYFSFTQKPETTISENQEFSTQKEILMDIKDDGLAESNMTAEETNDRAHVSDESNAQDHASIKTEIESNLEEPTKTELSAEKGPKKVFRLVQTQTKDIAPSQHYPPIGLSELKYRNTELEILENSSNELITQIAMKSLVGKITDPVSEEENEIKNNFINWSISGYYQPEWPMGNEEMYVSNRQYGLKVGVEFKKWSAQFGLGLRTESTPSKYRSFYSSYDSVGFFYDIDYYEVVQGYPDSIIIHYTIESVFDSIEYESETQGPNQKQKWIVIPFELGYQLYQTRKYELNAHVLAQFGWNYSSEKTEMNLGFNSTTLTENISSAPQSGFLQLGIGLENNFNVFPHWWIYAEPRVNYYTKKPYKLDNSDHSGPISIGVQVGVKYKFRGR